jgi:class 3 adenylate cyclase
MASKPASRAEVPLLIVFGDLSRFALTARNMAGPAIADFIDGFYRKVEREITESRGRVVKFMGDAFLAVWEEQNSGAAVAALPALKLSIDQWCATQGVDMSLLVKAHFGTAVAGPFGLDGHFDLIGSEVNLAATLPARTISLSVEAFRKLAPEARRGWQKHSAPVVYIPAGDVRPRT